METITKIVVSRLAFYSYSIVKGLAAVGVGVAVVAKYILEYELSLLFVAAFFVVIGMFVGYSVAYYSIKFLNNQKRRPDLSLN